MKKIILSLSAAVLTLGLHAQEKEMDATISAFNSKNYTVAIQEAQKANGLLESNRTIEPKDLAEFYFSAGKAAKASGDMVLAAEYFGKLGKLENANYYKAKNKDTKNWEYFYDAAEAKNITNSGNYGNLKESNLDSKLLQTIAVELRDDAKTSLDKANEALNSGNYEVAGKEYQKTYYLYQALGNPSEMLRYYSAVSMLQTDEKAKAAKILQELVDTGFDGVEISYVATDESGQEVSYPSKEIMDLQVKLGNATNPKTVKTESLQEELYSNATYAWYTLEEWDKALAVGKVGLEKFPNNDNMNQIVTGVYYKSGNSEEFIKNLREKIDSGNAKAVDYFNLAKTLEDQSADLEKVKGYYKTAIAKDPNYTEAYINLAYAILKEDETYITLMNENLGTSSKEKKIYKESLEKRRELYREAIPYLERAFELDSDNIPLIKVLYNSYDLVDNDEKFFEFKKLYESKISN